LPRPKKLQFISGPTNRYSDPLEYTPPWRSHLISHSWAGESLRTYEFLQRDSPPY
jgi:hypothetical protein